MERALSLELWLEILKISMIFSVGIFFFIFAEKKETTKEVIPVVQICLVAIKSFAAGLLFNAIGVLLTLAFEKQLLMGYVYKNPNTWVKNLMMLYSGWMIIIVPILSTFFIGIFLANKQIGVKKEAKNDLSKMQQGEG